MNQETLLLLIDETVRQIQLESQKYRETIRANRPFSEAKQVRQKIKHLTEELSLLLSHNEIQDKFQNGFPQVKSNLQDLS